MADEQEDQVVKNEEVEGSTEDEQEGSDAADNEGGGDDEMSEQDLIETKNLYKLLKDPRTSTEVVRALAAKAGLLNPQTPQETKVAKKELKDLINEALPDNLKFLGQSLTQVFEKVLEQERAEIAEQTQALTQSQVNNEVDSALNRLARETNGQSRKLEGKMISLMDQLQASPNTSTYDYLKLLYQTANSGKSAASASQQMADRIKRNSTDAASRLASTGSRSSGSGKQQITGPEKKGIKAAVQFALTKLEKD